MNATNSYMAQRPKTADCAIDRWENEGGAHEHDSPDLHYGRRVEADCSWTVYHVFTGVPARINGRTMIGLSQGAATDGMLSLNSDNEARRRDLSHLMAVILTAPQAARECRL